MSRGSIKKWLNSHIHFVWNPHQQQLSQFQGCWEVSRCPSKGVRRQTRELLVLSLLVLLSTKASEDWKSRILEGSKAGLGCGQSSHSGGHDKAKFSVLPSFGSLLLHPILSEIRLCAYWWGYGGFKWRFQKLINLQVKTSEKVKKSDKLVSHKPIWCVYLHAFQRFLCEPNFFDFWSIWNNTQQNALVSRHRNQSTPKNQ